MIIFSLRTLYYLALAGLALYGCLGLLTFWLLRRHKHAPRSTPTAPQAWPPVTVQLPIYNERYVVAPLLAAAARLDYPRARLQIQVIDDSDDDTTAQARTLVDHYRAQGINMQHVRRSHRGGFKAGALAAATPAATGQFIALFDADFQPPPDFLRRTIPHFMAQSRLGILQTRWGHLNHDHSPLTAAQAIAIDKHFAVEQMVRHRAHLFPKFNGSGTVIRRHCLDDAGGWQSDTVCEDLCLSTRAALAAWEFDFLPAVIAPAQLPTTAGAYKTQQARWAKGSFQCLRKFGRAIAGASDHSWGARLYALLTMSGYITHPLLLLALLTLVPLTALDVSFSPQLLWLGLAGLGQPLLFVWAQRALYADWRRRLRHFPTLLLVAVGLAPSISRALFEAGRRGEQPFRRTPKIGAEGHPLAPAYRLPFDWIVLLEIGLALYALLGILFCLYHHNLGPLSFLFTCAAGFTYMATLSLREAPPWSPQLRPPKRTATPPSPHQ